jgi:thiamine pyrophosphokinase
VDKGLCYVVGAGDCDDFPIAPHAEAFVIAADAGYRHLARLGIEPDLLIGDFDSLAEKPTFPRIISLNQDKDETDSFAAVREGLGLGYRLFHLYGCFGGRADHSLANLQLLAYLAENGAQGWLFDKNSAITAISGSALGFANECQGTVSVFSHSSRSQGVTIKGLKYELAEAELTNTVSVGVSNEFCGKKSLISVREGTLMIVVPAEAPALTVAVNKNGK